MRKTASEQIFTAWHGFIAHLQTMSPAELAVNAVLSGLTLALAMGTVWAVRALVRYGARRFPGPATAEKTVRASRVARLLAFVVKIAAAVAVLMVIANIWGWDVLAWAETGVGERAVGAVIRLALLFIVGVALFEGVGFLIGHSVARVAENAVDPRRRAQLNTLGPLLRGISQTALATVLILMALGEVGVDIGPLLAGAGVVGIAVGFGAQTLVKDFLTGFFLIVEDIVSVGDIARIGDETGIVEQMTLRTIRLRDFDGTLHVFPYGEAQVVHNLTKSFGYYVFNLSISYSSNIDRALEVMRQVGEELRKDKAFKALILEPMEVFGVDKLADSGVVLKGRIKTQPLQQWAVGREYNRRIKLAFDREGIEIPFPHMKIVLPDQQLSALAHMPAQAGAGDQAGDEAAEAVRSSRA